MDWYYVLNDERKGPVSEDEIKNLIDSGIINNETLVWNEKMEDWEKYGDINKKVPPKIPQNIKNVSYHKGIGLKNDNDEKTFGMLCHLSAFSGFLIPFGSILGPLVVWLIKRNQYKFVDICGKESLNFQISTAIYSIILLMVMAASLVSENLGFSIIGAILMLVYAVIYIFCVIKASIVSNNKEVYRYPFTIRFFSTDYSLDKN